MRAKLRLLLVRTAMLWLLAPFVVFWYLPSMISQESYRQSENRVFAEGEACWEREYEAKRYAESAHCFDTFNAWTEKNAQPEPGINWPWKVWKESEGGRK
jgi:hypothetical protein